MAEYKMVNGHLVEMTLSEIDARNSEVAAWEAGQEDRLKAQKIKDLWEEADRIVNSHMDQNSRDRYLAWLIDSESSQAKKDKIKDNQDWADSVWNAYKLAKDDVVDNGNLESTLPQLSGAPWSFWDIAYS